MSDTDPLSDSELVSLAELISKHPQTFYLSPLWEPERFFATLIVLSKIQSEVEWCDRMRTAPELTPESQLQSNPALWKWRVPYYVNGKLQYGPEADTPSGAVRAVLMSK
jgi:hypothetical protein